MKNHTRQIGSTYEHIAVKYLQEHNIEILEVNYRKRQGEIDIIGKEDDTLLFIEVKFRKSDRFGTPLESISPLKQKKIRTVAELYLAEKKTNSSSTCRFDVIGILGQDIIWLKDAF